MRPFLWRQSRHWLLVFGVSCILNWGGGGGGLFNGSLFLIYIATLILTVTVICAETISVDTLITPEESKMATDGFPFCESNTHGRKESRPWFSISCQKFFLLRHSLLTTICFKNYSIIFIDISVQLWRLRHSQFAQNREIWTCALVPKQRKTFDIIPLSLLPWVCFGDEIYISVSVFHDFWPHFHTII